jgi:hypothetical protein
MMADRSHRYADAYAGRAELTITGVIVASKDTRRRTIHPGRYIPRRSMQRTIRLWLSGDDKAAGASLISSIARYYEGVMVDYIERIWFE